MYIKVQVIKSIQVKQNKNQLIDGDNGINYFYNRNTKFSNAIKKYGWNNFKHYIIAKNLTLERANHIEKALIHYHRDILKKCYNLADGGEGNGHSHTEATKEKLRRINTGRKISDETKLKMAKSSGKPVVIIMKDNSILEFYSIGKAAEYLNLSVSGLKYMINRQRFNNDKVLGMKINYKEVNNDS